MPEHEGEYEESLYRKLKPKSNFTLKHITLLQNNTKTKKNFFHAEHALFEFWVHSAVSFLIRLDVGLFSHFNTVQHSAFALDTCVLSRSYRTHRP